MVELAAIAVSTGLSLFERQERKETARVAKKKQQLKGIAPALKTEADAPGRARRDRSRRPLVFMGDDSLSLSVAGKSVFGTEQLG